MKDHLVCENQVVDHLSRLEEEGISKESLDLNNDLPNDHILVASHDLIPWFVDFATSWQASLYLKASTSIEEINSCTRLESNIGMSNTSFKFIFIVLSNAVFPKWRCYLY